MTIKQLLIHLAPAQFVLCVMILLQHGLPCPKELKYTLSVTYCYIFIIASIVDGLYDNPALWSTKLIKKILNYEIF